VGFGSLETQPVTAASASSAGQSEDRIRENLMAVP